MEGALTSVAKTADSASTNEGLPNGGKPDVDHSNPLARTMLAKLDYDQLTNCMRCGFCLPACPTFRETGLEPESPRGRIALMKAVVDGVMEPDLSFQEQMNHCLGCRACEPACPADVKYGQLIEQTRDAIEEHATTHRRWVRGLRSVAFKGLFPHQNRMKRLGALLKVYQKTGLNRAVRSAGIMKLFPAHLRDMERILPEASSKGVRELIGERHPARGERRGKVALFRGCIMDALFAQTNVNTVLLLTEAGFEVVIPQTQNCCGALHAHSGETDQARELARSNVRAFLGEDVDFVVTNAGGCGAILLEYDHLLQDDEEWAEPAARFSKRVIDVSELLLRHGNPLKFEPADAEEPLPIVTYQDSCHLRNVMRSSDAPRQLIRQAAGASFVEMKEADRCCGSAGIYNLTQPEMAGSILEKKMEHANRTDARTILTSNPGCLLQMKAGVAKHGTSPETTESVHIVDYLYKRLRPSPSARS
ncbi:(Fe-S)-binding protein [Cohnella xylanilytica]|uniref:Glycolate oxidase iron-sulfur subunit n=2 Tax=Cohnella xylanilytica TaxID=557555 RepID=A0A841U075_9BACL|nr:(Fe-S)-binding protein [Cohnella xylanilytica]